MSKILGEHVVLVPTVLGGMTVKTTYIVEMDIDDIVRSKAVSQATLISLLNTGRDFENKSQDSKAMNSSFANLSVPLKEI